MKIETGADMKAARLALGWSQYRLADELRIGKDTEAGAAKIREIEAGNRAITGTLGLALELLVERHQILNKWPITGAKT